MDAMDGNLAWVHLASVLRACDHCDKGSPSESAHTNRQGCVAAKVKH